MARNECSIDAALTQVWAVLADPGAYEQWVVGCKRIRGADGRWPAHGARFHHSLGVGPLQLRDHTVVERSVAPTLLSLRARARPLGTFFVTLRLVDEGPARTRVVMVEEPADRLTRLLFSGLAHRLVRARNVASLERLCQLAEVEQARDSTHDVAA